MVRRIKTGKYIYDDGAEKLEIKEFQKRYGPQKGKEIYFATVVKIREEQLAKRYLAKRKEKKLECNIRKV